MSDSGFGSFVAGLVIGGLIGAAVGLLLAPESGEEMRGQAKRQRLAARSAANRDEQGQVDGRDQDGPDGPGHHG